MKINQKINIDKWEEELYNKLNRSNIKIFTYDKKWDEYKGKGKEVLLIISKVLREKIR